MPTNDVMDHSRTITGTSWSSGGTPGESLYTPPNLHIRAGSNSNSSTCSFVKAQLWTRKSLCCPFSTGKHPFPAGSTCTRSTTPATCGLDLPVGAADSHRLAWITVPERSGDDLPEDPGPIDSLRLAPIRISPPVQSPFTAQFTKPRDENGTSSQCPPCTSKHIYCIESPPEAKTPTCIACRTPIPSIRGTPALPRRCPTRPRRTRLTFDLSNKPSQGKKAGTNERT